MKNPGGEGFRPNDYAPQLRALESAALEHFLEGGQAVNAWAEIYSNACPALAGLAPFTSRDCDIWLGPEAFRRIDEILAGELIKASSPADGQLGILKLDKTGKKTIDLLDGVFGLSYQEVQRAWQRSLVVSGIRILDPLFLFKGKCHNLTTLPQEGRQDEKHLRILLEILPAHFGNVLMSCQSGEVHERAFLKEVKTFLNFGKDVFVRRAMAATDSTLMDAVPFERMIASGLPKIEGFARKMG